MWFYALLVCLLACLHFDVPGCTRRTFPPVRDAESYVLEVYHVEVPGDAGRGHPDMEEVLRGHHTKLLDRYPVLRLDIGGTAKMEYEAAKQSVQIEARLTAVQREFATLALDIRPWERASANIRLPLDTWGAAMTGVDSAQERLRLLVFRLNRPGV